MATIVLTESFRAARRDMLASFGIDTGTVKRGYCPVSGCTESHDVRKVSIWENHPQYVGTAHGASYVYETWMIDPNA